jgi:hypothetical protein
MKRQNSSTEVPASAVSSATSQSLEVSTEIVTSPNGHRDIEIKFYSSSPPVGATMVTIGCTKNSSDDLTVCDEKSAGTVLSSSPEEVSPQDAVHVGQKVQQESGESSVNTQTGNAKEQDAVSCEQDAALCDYGDVWAGDLKTRDEKEGCLVSDHGFCEQSAKTLGKEVDQLRLHAEE